jgi:hypothetical protein
MVIGLRAQQRTVTSSGQFRRTAWTRVRSAALNVISIGLFLF